MAAPPDWYRSFYEGLAVEFWLAAASDADTRAEADFIERALGLSAGARVLDVPCGGGRHAVELAARGLQPTGVDLSPKLLAAARARAAERGVAVAWEELAMTDVPWQGSFDGAYCFGNSFGYLDDDGDRAFLEAVHRALEPGARFALDTQMIAETLFPYLTESLWNEAGGVISAMRRRYEPRTSRVESDVVLVKGAVVERHAMSTRVYGCRELCELCEHVGFADLEVFGGLEREPYRLGSRRFILVGKKG